MIMTIVNKIKKAKITLPLPSSIDELNKRPEARNLLGIYSNISATKNLLANFKEKTFLNLKINCHKF